MLQFDTGETTDLPLILPESGPSSFHERLRKTTRACHDEVDGLFGQFDLTDRGSYGDFLAAHARALLPLEEWLDLPALLPGASLRSATLLADLEALGRPPIAQMPLDWPRGDPSRWGAAYVIEGSRLGGLVLLRAVPAEFPCEYLAAAHAPGAWRAFLAQIDRLAAERGGLWEAEAIATARRTFRLFSEAATAWGAMRGS